MPETNDDSKQRGVRPDDFIDSTRDEIEEQMVKVGPIWRSRLENYHDLLYIKAMRSGFWYGALFSAAACFMILLVSRLIAR